MKVTWENMKVYYILKYSEKYTKKAGSNSETIVYLKYNLAILKKQKAAWDSYLYVYKGNTILS